MKNSLNKLLLGFCLCLSVAFAKAQTGLDGIVVEKYYVATAADHALDATLPIGAVTYRVYVDLAAGAQLVNVFGGPGVNPLKIYSSQNFYNESTNGAGTSNAVSNGLLTSGATIVDSWFSFGGGGGTKRAIQKSEDTDGGIATPLTNSGGLMGSPLTTHDGRIAAAPNAVVASTVGADIEGGDPAYAAFANSVSSNSFNTLALGAGFSLYGSGPTNVSGTGANNLVLIGQFTTAGTFGYELNLQVKNSLNVVEAYYANNVPPGANNFTHPSLTLTPNDPPTISSFTATPNGSVIVGTTINLNAVASDVAPGTISSVKFYHNGALISTDNTPTYDATFNAVAGANNFYARAFDNSGDSTQSNTITVTGGANQAPTVTITGVPASITQPDVVTVVATPIDVDGTIANVKFYLDNALVFTDVAAPWEYIWPSTVGSHNFKAEATDNLGLTGAQSATSSVNVVLNNPPTCILTSPLITGAYTAPAIVPLAATATDLLDVVSPGSVVKVRFFVNGVFVGEDLTSPYTYNWTSSIGTAVFTARSYDNRGDSTTSASVTLEIADPNALPYKITNLNQTCVPSTFCLTIAAVDTVANVIGYDFVLNYDRTKVSPTGVVIVNNDLTDSTDVDVASSINDALGKMNISIYFNSGAPSGASWSGNNGGDLICVEFIKKPYPIFDYQDTAEFSISTLQESYVDGVRYPQVSAGRFTTYKDSLVIAPLKFWADNSPIVFTNAAANLITNIYGSTNSSCANKSIVPVQPDANGNFTHSIWNGTYVSIERDILPTTSVQSVVNGYDVYLVRRLLILDPSFRPSIYQMIAMDVNRDGVISAGDASQIAQRAVLQYPEFRQAWNYNSNGTRIVGSGDSKDWTFMLGSSITTTAAFGISTTFPSDNGVGFSKYRVPLIPFCLQTPVTDALDCPIITNDSYIGIMLGDVNGSYNGIASSALLRNSDRVIFNVSKAIKTDTYIDIPVTVASGSEIHALDFSMLMDQSNLKFVGIINQNANIQMFDHFNQNDQTIRVTSNSLENYDLSQPVLYVRVELKNGQIQKSDLLSVVSLLNGELVPTEIRTDDTEINNNNVIANVYPNPSSGKLYVSVEADANIQLFDLSGKEVIQKVFVNANKEIEINASNLFNGVYMMKISNANFIATKKVVINR